MYSFAGLIRRTPPPTFSDTAITDRHSDTTIFQLRAHWVRISWSIGSEKSFGHVPPVGVEPLTSCVQGETTRSNQLIIVFEQLYEVVGQLCFATEHLIGQKRGKTHLGKTTRCIQGTTLREFGWFVGWFVGWLVIFGLTAL